MGDTFIFPKTRLLSLKISLFEKRIAWGAISQNRTPCFFMPPRDK